MKRMFLQLLLLLLFFIAFSSENFGSSPSYAVIAGIGPAMKVLVLQISCKRVEMTSSVTNCKSIPFMFHISSNVPFNNHPLANQQEKTGQITERTASNVFGTTGLCLQCIRCSSIAFCSYFVGSFLHAYQIKATIQRCESLVCSSVKYKDFPSK